MIAPISFGHAARRLFGLYHAPLEQAQPTRPAVVLCNAFGQEAIRAHRFQRLLAERLARSGHAVLRFDYYGCGDSMGEDGDADLDGWAGDLLAAHSELQHRSGATGMAWIGMRLGANVGLRAAHSAPAGLARLILWDPVPDGAAYLAYLRERHIASLEHAYSLAPAPPPRALARDSRHYRDEAIGFALPPRFRQQLEAIRIGPGMWPATPADIVVMADPASAEGKDVERACAHDPGRVRTIAMQHGTDWSTDTAGNTALVPAAALLALTQLLEEAP